MNNVSKGIICLLDTLWNLDNSCHDLLNAHLKGVICIGASTYRHLAVILIVGENKTTFLAKQTLISERINSVLVMHSLIFNIK